MERTWCTCLLRALTSGVLVDLYRSIVHLSQSLHFNVVAIALILALAVDVVIKVLVRNVLGEIVGILQLQERGQDTQ